VDQQFLLPGDLVTTRKAAHLATLLGSCVSVCLSNGFQRIAGMNHFMLPEAGSSSDRGRYGDTSIRQLVKTLFALDAEPAHYRARLYGGARVIGHLGAMGDIGARNVELARRMLAELRIPILHEEVGGTKGRRIDFNTENDVIECRVVGVTGSSSSKLRRAVATRVLIVDDSPVARRVLKMGLEGAPGIVVVGEAGNAFEARDQVLSLDPDVLTLDIEMPQVDGVTFLRQLMKHMPKPVVVMSSLATAGSEIEARARAAGAIEVIDKARLEPAKGLEGIRSILAPALRRAARHRFVKGPAE
jgi:two-component system, chemotaxis family, protein-glutamate methylesterase/glutaminase